jgi:hypothetical protein
MKTIEIHSEHVLCLDDDAYTLTSVYYSVPEFTIGEVSFRDDQRLGKPPLYDINATVLKRLLESPFSPLRTLSEHLNIPRMTVWEQMTKSLGQECRDFK